MFKFDKKKCVKEILDFDKIVFLASISSEAFLVAVEIFIPFFFLVKEIFVPLTRLKIFFQFQF